MSGTARFPVGFDAMRLSVVTVLALIASCGSAGEVKLCGRIPEGGCPLGRGGTCDDKLCEALYDCAGGNWTLVLPCDRSGADAGAGGHLEDSGADGPCDLVLLDHTGETSGCAPDLQSPDCPAGAAETCAQAACFTECADFYLCTAAGWTAVAYCDDQGKVVVTP
jgi:hypothetical protein